MYPMAVYATTDLHGRKDLYLKIKEMLRPDDQVFFLGDAGDRGPDGWALIKMIYEDPQFVYLKGNHEDMLVDAIRAYMKNPDYPSKEYKLLKQNGGQCTFESWWKDGADGEWADKLDKLPVHLEYTNKDGKLILMSHAGYTPWTDPDDATKIIIPDEFELVWNRDHFYDNWNEECSQNCIIVHGHTTIPSLAKRLCDKREELKHGAYWYENDRKVCLDNWSAFSDVVCLLNLDTFEEIIVEF
jgi:hypothetical protein